jgi:hypothetical protein
VLTDSIPKRGVCTVRIALERMEGETRETFLYLMGHADATHAAISKALKAREFDISESTVGRHRKGGCSCGR